MKKDEHHFSPQRLADIGKLHDVLGRARSAGDATSNQARDRLGTPATGRETL